MADFSAQISSKYHNLGNAQLSTSGQAMLNEACLEVMGRNSCVVQSATSNRTNVNVRGGHKEARLRVMGRRIMGCTQPKAKGHHEMIERMAIFEQKPTRAVEMLT